MSTNISPIDQIEYDSFVKAAYQSSGFKLREACRLRSDVVGSSVEFRKMGTVVSTPTGYGQQVSGQDAGFSVATVNLQKFTTPIYVDRIEDLTTNVEAKMESSQLIGMAMGRMSDQLKIDAMNNSAAETIANNSTGFTYDKYTQIMQYFDDNAIPLNERWVAMKAIHLRTLLHAKQFTSKLYTENRVIDNAFAREYLGFNLVIIPKMPEGGLPTSGGISTAFAWHKMSLGTAIGENFSTEINYVPEKTSNLVNGVFSAGSTVIDVDGVLKVNNDDSYDPTTTSDSCL